MTILDMDKSLLPETCVECAYQNGAYQMACILLRPPAPIYTCARRPDCPLEGNGEVAP
jgi:hypothetical protein